MKVVGFLLILCGLFLWGGILSVNSRLSATNLTDLSAIEMNAKTPARISGLQVAIEPHKKYSWSSLVSVSGQNGEFGFFIDEFDVNGEWISGQWKGSTNEPAHKIFTYEYVPSSENVRFASPQYYLKRGSQLSVRVSRISFSER